MRPSDIRSRRARLAGLASMALVAVLSWGCEPEPAAQLAAPAATATIPGAAASAASAAASTRRPPGTGLDVDGDGTIGAHTDALLILRFIAGFRGETLIQDVIGEQCKRCTAPEIEAYLEAL